MELEFCSVVVLENMHIACVELFNENCTKRVLKSLVFDFIACVRLGWLLISFACA